MRLLHVGGDGRSNENLKISLSEFIDDDIPAYLILSHRWREDEVLFADMALPDHTNIQSKKGYAKIEACCRIALQRNIDYVWIDTCCIDKTSSAELSEAINSMYKYYADAIYCIAYLDDIEDHHAEGESLLSHASWFKRGWTLQELIAPKKLYFYSREWRELGTKEALCLETSAASGIAQSVLKHCEKLEEICVSEKMSWAAQRNTTRAEDEAYCLMGLFGVNMATLYGEGRLNAFRRLQLEIMQVRPDHTLFAWHSETTNGDMLAPSVSCFKEGADYIQSKYDTAIVSGPRTKPDFNMTNAGLHIELPMSPVPKYGSLHFAFLACKTTKEEHRVAICLRKRKNDHSPSFSRIAFARQTVYHFEQTKGNKFTDIASTFHLVYISRVRPGGVPCIKEPQSHSRWAKIELCVKARKPLPQILRSGYLIDTRQQNNRLEEIMDNGREFKNFRNSELPIQHCICASLSIPEFHHELVTLVGNKGINILFGEMEPDIWFFAAFKTDQFDMHVENSVNNGLQMERSKFYSFPFGRYWLKDEDSHLVILKGQCAVHKTVVRTTRMRCDIGIELRSGIAGERWWRLFVVIDKRHV